MTKRERNKQRKIKNQDNNKMLSSDKVKISSVYKRNDMQQLTIKERNERKKKRIFTINQVHIRNFNTEL